MPNSNNKGLIPVKLKRKLSLVMMVLVFVLYYLATDPDTSFFQNLPFGAPLVLTLNIFIITIISIVVIEFVPDYIIDMIYGPEEQLRYKAVETSQGAGQALIAKSIRILAYSFIMAASIIAYNIG